MKALDWLRYLERQWLDHGKVLYRVTELSNVARRHPHAMNVELARLVKRKVIARYANGVYGLPGAARAEDLVTALDPGAYITGHYALHRQNFVTQRPSEITCFTNRRHNRSKKRETPLGRINFVCVNPNVYAKPAEGTLAPPEQALCDFVHVLELQGLDPRTVVTFRNLSRVRRSALAKLATNYPPAVAAYFASWPSPA